VGSDCLRDFLGRDAAAFEVAALIVTELKDWCEEWREGSGGYDSIAYALDRVLTVACSVVRQFGYKSRSKAEIECCVATADRVAEHLTDTARGVARNAIEPEDKTEAGRVRAWLDAMEEPEPGNDYLRNLYTVARAGWVSARSVGLAASSVVAYRRAMERARRAESDAQSVYVGTVGKREVFNVAVLAVIENEGMYGVTGIHKLRTTDGNLLTWFASGSAHWLAPGEKYTVKATVGKHEEYKGVKQTVVKRVAVQD